MFQVLHRYMCKLAVLVLGGLVLDCTASPGMRLMSGRERLASRSPVERESGQSRDQLWGAGALRGADSH